MGALAERPFPLLKNSTPDGKDKEGKSKEMHGGNIIVAFKSSMEIQGGGFLLVVLCEAGGCIELVARKAGER